MPIKLLCEWVGQYNLQNSTNILSYKKRFVGMFKNTRIFETYL